MTYQYAKFQQIRKEIAKKIARETGKPFNPNSIPDFDCYLECLRQLNKILHEVVTDADGVEHFAIGKETYALAYDLKTAFALANIDNALTHDIDRARINGKNTDYLSVRFMGAYVRIRVHMGQLGVNKYAPGLKPFPANSSELHARIDTFDARKPRPCHYRVSEFVDLFTVIAESIGEGYRVQALADFQVNPEYLKRA